MWIVKYWFQHTAARRRLAAGSAFMVKGVVFQHTAARRRLVLLKMEQAEIIEFQHTAARRRLGNRPPESQIRAGFNTQPPEGGWNIWPIWSAAARVSTHSRPKAAGQPFKRYLNHGKSFNTQPPEGGWPNPCPTSAVGLKFQHTAARRRLAL